MRPDTLAEAAERMRLGQTSARAVSEFLDGFHTAPTPSEKLRMIAAEPAPGAEPAIDAYLAAIAEYLAKQYELPEVPSWVSSPTRYLAEPWFATSSTDPGMKEYLTFSSPAEFKSRNLFVEERPLRRARTPRKPL